MFLFIWKLAWFAGGLYLIHAGYDNYKSEKKPFNFNDKWPILLGPVLFGLFIVWISGVPHQLFWTSTVPGSFFEASEYSTKLKVLVFPDDSSVKNYKIPADVSRYLDCDSYDEGPCFKYYYVTTIYWPNGGYQDFDDCEVELSTQNNCTSGEDEYYIQLTNEKAN